MYALFTNKTVQGPVRLMLWVTLTANLFRNDDDHKDTRRCLSPKHIVSDPYNTNMGLCVGWILLRPRKEQKCRQAPSTARALWVVIAWRAVLVAMGSRSPSCLGLGPLAELLCKDAECCMEKHRGWRNHIAVHKMQTMAFSQLCSSLNYGS